VNDYERVASVIRHLDRNHTDQPDLNTLAARVHLSPYHFHRLFSAWAGVTPKDFLQCLTLSHAKARLSAGASVLDAALAGGLSGPGRLHDLCVSLEAASPGELKSGGEGWTMWAGMAASPFGKCLIAEGPRGICALAFVEPTGLAAEWASLRRQWPGVRLRRDDALAGRLAEQIFDRRAGSEERKGIRAFVRGTEFQVRVWRALLQVPPGALISYGQLAEVAGCSNAARAVGTAVGRNPVAYLIPCHRVIRETGVLGHYRWGEVRKRAMIAWESGLNRRPED
jgi:AraC family transcriptional regulator of adaptative response/methylated-DNA-[protein]-cysteine methyltransferase